MNLLLLDPFQNDFPEVIEEYLEHGSTKCIAFNRRGTLLAAGCTDGSCVIWDFDTRGVAKELRDPGCNGSVTSVSWSKCGRRLLAASTDKSVALWDVAKGTKISAVCLQQTALHCRLDPGTVLPTLCLACPLSGAPILVDFEINSTQTLPVVVPPGHGEDGPPNARGKHGDTSSAYSPSTASFNKKGDLIYVGNSKGEILVIDPLTLYVRAVVAVPGGAAIRHIVFSRDGKYLLTNSNDRIIRVFENLLPRERAAATLAEAVDSSANGDKDEGPKSKAIQCLRWTKDFQDAVNRMHWKAACFSGDGEWLMGASANKGEHKIHIWNRNFGQLARILEGPKEGLSDLAWHPTRPVVASVSMSGVVYLWAKDYTENWSAFAPDFKELEENEEYEEREDEFDIVPDADKVKPVRVEEDEEVDIMTMEKINAFSESDDSEDGLYFLPTVPLRDELPETSSHEQVATLPKPSSSSATETDGSPVSDRGPNSRQMELNPSPSVDSPAEDEVGPNGRIKRKRKLSEKAAELQAEKGRKSAQKGQGRISTTPKSSKAEGRHGFGRDTSTDRGSAEKAPVSATAVSTHRGPMEESPKASRVRESPIFKAPKVKSTTRHDDEEAGNFDDDEELPPRPKKAVKKKVKVASLTTKALSGNPNIDADGDFA